MGVITFRTWGGVSKSVQAAPQSPSPLPCLLTFQGGHGKGGNQSSLRLYGTDRESHFRASNPRFHHIAI